MMNFFDSSWVGEPVYLQTFGIVMGMLIILSVFFFFIRHHGPFTQAGFASLISWCIATPFLFIANSLPRPWSLIALSIIAIFGSKIFFQLMGMYHRSNFVWATYLGIFALAASIHYGIRELYNLAPMAFFGAVCLIPILRNSHKQMIQYLALTLMCFLFLGWSFMHLGWIWRLERGAYMVIYITILTETFDNISMAVSQFITSRTNYVPTKMFSRITPRRSWEGFGVAALLTLVIAFSFRHLLPERSETFWIASGLVAILGGSLGDLVLSVIRRDLGIKDVGVFIIGRGDLLSVMDRLIFVAPIFYYVMWYLETSSLPLGALPGSP